MTTDYEEFGKNHRPENIAERLYRQKMERKQKNIITRNMIVDIMFLVIYGITGRVIYLWVVDMDKNFQYFGGSLVAFCLFIPSFLFVLFVEVWIHQKLKGNA